MSGSKKVFTTLGSSNHVPEEREAFPRPLDRWRSNQMLLVLQEHGWNCLMW